MTELLLTEQMARQAIYLEVWDAMIGVNLRRRREKRPARQQAARKGWETRRTSNG